MPTNRSAWPCAIEDCRRHGVYVVTRRRGEGLQKRFCSVPHLALWAARETLEDRQHAVQVADFLAEFRAQRGRA